MSAIFPENYRDLFQKPGEQRVLYKISIEKAHAVG